MSLRLAIQAFFKALKNPQKAQDFVKEKKEIKHSKEDDITPSHLRLLALLQQSSRLIDFLKEDLSTFNDAQVGAAVRKVHLDCAKSMEELVTIRPLFDEKEGATVHVPKGYDPSTIKVVGKVKGEPPFSGTLVHRGWKAHKRSLPKLIGEIKPEVICPAEIEVQ